MTKYLAAALLTTALFACTASAQTASNKTAATGSSVAAHKEGEWRASKLVGLNVYNDANEKIGDSMMSSWTSPARSRTSSWGLAASSAWANITWPSHMTS
jgi:Spy/CpxP family protein refolding chaperone